jgi:hypothetical protein
VQQSKSSDQGQGILSTGVSDVVILSEDGCMVSRESFCRQQIFNWLSVFIHTDWAYQKLINSDQQSTQI